MDTSKLKTYFYGLDKQAREQFATDCKTTIGQIVQIVTGNRNCNPTLAIEFEKHSGGLVVCDDLCPTTDFEFLRSQETAQQLAG